MTIETYRRAGEILEEKERLEEVLQKLDPEYEFEKFTDIVNKLYMLGKEFAML